MSDLIREIVFSKRIDRCLIFVQILLIFYMVAFGILDASTDFSKYPMVLMCVMPSALLAFILARKAFDKNQPGWLLKILRFQLLSPFLGVVVFCFLVFT